MVLVGRIGRPHGIRGHVLITPDTDFVKDRFKIGSVFWIQAPTGEKSLTLATVRFKQGRPIVSFEGFKSIESIAQLTGSELRVVEEDLSPLESGEFYHHQLIGSVVETLKGEHIGKVIRVEGSLNASRLIVQGARDQIQIPLAVDICVEIDPEKKRIRVNPPIGLLELNK
tara:strand:- start:6925 stop:7434 length:510 start_codon:yes stop_codon:yes gene_type:complete